MEGKRCSYPLEEINKKIKLEMLYSDDSEDEPYSSLLSDINDEPSNGSNESTFPWPNVWTSTMWEEKKKMYPWLTCESGKIGCSICASVRNIPSHVTNVSKRWSFTCISFNGHGRTARLASLRKKITEHLKSSSHLNAEMTIQNAKSKSVENVVNLLSVSDIISIQKIFTTAYYMLTHDNVDNDRFQLLLRLQLLNKIDIPPTLLTQFNIYNITEIIADELKAEMCREIIDSNKKIGILVDASIPIDNNTIFAIYILYEMDKTNPVQLKFLDIAETSATDTNTIIECMLSCLDKHGFNHNYLSNHLVSFASDGADRIFGKESKFGRSLNQRYPNIILWNCLNHRLQSHINESIIAIHSTNNFHSFIERLFIVYRQSSKIKNEIKSCCPDLDSHLKKYTNTSNLNDISCSFKIVSSIWEHYSELCSYLECKSLDASLSLSDRNVFSSLYVQISSKQFVLDLAVIHDVLSELMILGESLQKENISLGYADKLINRTIQYMYAMKNKKCKKSLEAESAANTLIFKSIALKDNPDLICFSYQDFIANIICYMESQSFVHSENPNIISELDYLNAQNWAEALDPGYGECAIESLGKRFKLSISKTITAYRDYLENGGASVPFDLRPLLSCSRIIVYNSSECEKSIDIINSLIAGTNCDIDCKTLSNLLFIKLYDSPLESWNSVEYVNKWLENCNASKQ